MLTNVTLPVPRRLAPVLALVALLAGCYQSFSGPSLDDAPLAVQHRAQLPSCGRFVIGYAGAGSDEGAAECFWNAYLDRRPAEFLWFFFSDAGPSTWVYRLEEDGAFVAYGLRPDGWVRLDCRSLTSTAGDDSLFGPGFLMNDCRESRLGS